MGIVMSKERIHIRYNILKISSISAFAGLKGGVNGNCKDVYFVRAIGVNKTYQEDIEKMDKMLSEKMQKQQGIYNRLCKLPKLTDADDIQYYTRCYEKWLESSKTKVFSKILEQDNDFSTLFLPVFQENIELYQKINPHYNASIEKNFVIKQLFWFDKVGEEYIKNRNLCFSMKIVIENIVKEQEYLFCYLLTQLGIDVLLLQYASDIESQIQQLGWSDKLVLGEWKKFQISEYNKDKYKISCSIPSSPPQSVSHNAPILQPALHNTEPVLKPAFSSNNGSNGSQERKTAKISSGKNEERRELEFEELALLASSVVMIAIHDRHGDIIGTGSGIMIGKNGYILTNHHVASGGSYYSVRIEEDNQVYQTNEIIKYNSVMDLSVIRIKRKLKPLLFYHRRKPLVRGQKVVAIGSPLGLFNSVSNGIISGFRQMDGVSMIQFTAPISHGSSGGAVFNMFGEVIGISTAGIDDGQNINLAVSYEFINTFIQGFD